MLSITDIHSHLLPGVDDGPETMEETLELLREAQRQGVTRMIATPHYHPERYLVDSQRALSVLEDVRRECRREGIEIELYPGQECYWYSGLLDALEEGKVLTMNGTRFVLVEFDPGTVYNVISSAVRNLGSSGYQVIIAHFERYQCLRGNPERLEELRNSGAFLQMNYDCLLQKDSLFHRNPWRKLVMDGEVDFLGSDTHGMNFRPPHMAQAGAWLEEHVDEDTLWDLMERNPGMLLKGE